MASHWRGSRRRERFNPDWPRVRRMALERDGYRCRRMVEDEYGMVTRCVRRATEVDHIRRALPGMPDDDSLENLESLCAWHHARKTQCESAEARRAYAADRRRREWYSHPAFR